MRNEKKKDIFVAPKSQSTTLALTSGEGIDTIFASVTFLKIIYLILKFRRIYSHVILMFVVVSMILINLQILKPFKYLVSNTLFWWF